MSNRSRRDAPNRWGRAVIAIGSSLLLAAASAAQPAPRPDEVAYYRLAAGAKLCAAAYAFRHREERTSARGEAAKAGVQVVVAEIARLTGEAPRQIEADTIARAQAVRERLMARPGDSALDAADLVFVIGMCDRAYGQKISQAWTPKVRQETVWDQKAQSVCTAFYIRALTKAPRPQARQMAVPAADQELKRLAGQIDRTLPETYALMRKDIADYDKAFADGRLNSGKFYETIEMCDNHYSYYVSDNWEDPRPFDCNGAAVTGLRNAAGELAKAKRQMPGDEYDEETHNYYVALSCGHLKVALTDMTANSCPADLVGKVRQQYVDISEELEKLNSSTGLYYSCSSTP